VKVTWMSGWVRLNSVTLSWSAAMKTGEPHCMSQYWSWTAPSAGGTVGWGVTWGSSVASWANASVAGISSDSPTIRASSLRTAPFLATATSSSRSRRGAKRPARTLQSIAR
jgi:hypothetical protein